MVNRVIMTIKDYHAKKEWHGSTHCKLAYSSMFKFREGIDSEDDYSDTKDKAFGRFYHKFVLEPNNVSEEFIIMNTDLRPEPDKTMGSKLNKEWEEIIGKRAEMNGQEVVKLDEYEKAEAMRSVFKRYVKTKGDSYSVVERIMEHSVPETSFFIDNYLGIKAKCRPDILCHGSFIADLKSVADASPEAFAKAMIKWGWDIQVALYSDLIAMFEAQNEEVPTSIRMPFYMIAQEKKKPYDFCVYDVSDYYNLGKLKLVKAIDNIRSSSQEGYWGLIPADRVGLKLTPPNWAYNGLDANPNMMNETNEFNNDSDEEDSE